MNEILIEVYMDLENINPVFFAPYFEDKSKDLLQKVLLLTTRFHSINRKENKLSCGIIITGNFSINDLNFIIGDGSHYYLSDDVKDWLMFG